MKPSKSLIIIPAYNEGKNILRVIERIRQNAPNLDVAVVNDGSLDGTAAIAKKRGAMVINLLFHMGYGAAVQTGYKYALRSGYDYAIQIDGDGQHEPGYIMALLQELKTDRADVIIGSRFATPKQTRRYRGSFSRRVGMRLFGAVTSMIIRQKVTDPTSGYIGLNRKVLEYLSSDVYPADYPDADVIIMLHRAGFRIKEIPVVMYENKQKGSLHRGVGPLYYIFKMVLSIFVTTLRKK